MSWRQYASQKGSRSYGSGYSSKSYGAKGYDSSSGQSKPSLPSSRPKVSRSSGSRPLVELSDNEDAPPTSSMLAAKAPNRAAENPRDSAGQAGTVESDSSSSAHGPTVRMQADETAVIILPSSPPLSKTQSIFAEDDSETLNDLQLQSEFKLHYKTPSTRLIDRRVGDSSRKRDAQRAQLSNAESFKRAREDGTLNLTNGQPTAREVQVEYHAIPELGPAPPLTPQQQAILDRIMEGESMFFTGSAGSGKSVLLRAIIGAFRQRMEGQRNAVSQGLVPVASGRVIRWKLAVTASTGMAAINIGGRTLHSWAGIGLGIDPVGQLITKINRSKVFQNNWQTTHALIIDEISMIDGKLLDKLDAIGRALRGNQKPFGGLQVIFTGDFHQLPPVAKRNEAPATFAFEALVWPEAIPMKNMARLTQVFRQRDIDFVVMLEEMRKGKVTMGTEKQLKALCRPLKYDDGIAPTELYPSVNEVNEINRRELGRLSGEEVVYRARDIPGSYASGKPVEPADATRQLNDNTKWPQEINLKVGAVVMLVTNIQDSFLVNGSIGKVVAFMNPREAIEQGVQVLGEGSHDLDPNAIKWPVIEFIPSKYATGAIAKRTMITRMHIELLNGAAKVQASREQVPLILACTALTIHKSQGQTLERVKVNLAKVFAEGQTYVALSRAVDMAGLEVTNFSRDKVKVSQRVLHWAETFEGE